MKTLAQAFALSLAVMVAGHAQNAVAPDFELPRFGGGAPVKLSDYTGKVVVLDFFAYWCAPCAKSAPIIEKDIQKYYDSKRGNAHGTPVQVISINVESEEASKTAAFVKKHGSSLVVNDKEGATLKNYGGAGLPYVVIIDGTQGTSGQPAFKVVYARPGFPGVQPLRNVIDSLGVPVK